MRIQDWLGEDNTLGIDIWTKKYQFDNETFDEWLDRTSGGNKDIRQLMIDKKFLFGGRILANRGLEKFGKKITLSNCYVVSAPEDNIESIYDAAAKLARTYSYGGGCGIDISKLAPKGAKVNNAANKTSGAVSFMDTYSQVTAQIGQNGRRGALMISLDCHHPDLEEFIDIKTDLDRVTKANISIRFTDDFMQAVENDEDFDLTFVRNETGEEIVKTVKAKEIFMKLAKNNWDFAEPGCLFWDRICDYNLLANTEEFEYAGTNPCAEEPLPAGGSCLLGSLNLSEFVDENGDFYESELRKCVHTAIRGLNEVLEEGLPLHPLQEQRDSVSDWRQVGLGIMGLADMLIKMEMTYGSPEAIEFCDHIGRIMGEEAIKASAILSIENGPFPKCNMEEIAGTEFFANHITNTTDYHNILASGLRNSQLLTIAPTGTLSTMLGISGGIEPIFANSYTRKTESLHGHDEYYKVYTPIVAKYMEEHNLTEEEELPEFFVTAGTLNYLDRIAMQGVWQKHIDASISSTVNVPNDFTVEDTFNLYMAAWKNGLKGVTIFRDGCKRAGVLTTEAPKAEKIIVDDSLKRGAVIPASDELFGLKRKLMTGCGSLHCSAFFDPATGNLQEVYLSKGSTGGCNNFMIGLSRMISIAARGGVALEDIVDQLMSTGACPSYASRTATKHDTSRGSCCPMAVGYALREMKEQFDEIFGFDYDCCHIQEQKEKVEEEMKNMTVCPECGEPITFEGGCNICKNCGWSKCL